MKTITTVLMLFVTMLVWGQDNNESIDNDFPEKEVKTIERQWAGKSLQVIITGQKAGIHDFASAFCLQYPKYRPNACLTDYLKRPGDYSWEEKHYFVEDAPRNGFIKCDMGWQCDYTTEMCYWRRTNGHSLVGVLLQVGHEGEGSETDYALLFYDYDPSSRIMKPDMTIYRAVKELVRRHSGNLSFRLPNEEKDIRVVSVKWNAEDDFDFEEFFLKWTGNSFR